MKTVVLVIHLEIPEQQSANAFDMIHMFGKELVEWAAYEPLESNAPVRINIDSNGFEEI